jgi:hypothetical protein
LKLRPARLPHRPCRRHVFHSGGIGCGLAAGIDRRSLGNDGMEQTCDTLVRCVQVPVVRSPGQVQWIPSR